MKICGTLMIYKLEFYQFFTALAKSYDSSRRNSYNFKIVICVMLVQTLNRVLYVRYALVV